MSGRARLLHAAEELFGKASYRDTSVAEVCAHAGMATGSFYAWFGSKHELFEELVRAINRDVRHAMAAAIEDVDDQRSIEARAFRAFFDLMSARPHVYRIVRESEIVAPAVFREYYEQLARGYARGVRRAQLNGEVDTGLDPEVVAYVYTGIGYAIAMRWAEWSHGSRIPEDIHADVLTILARGLAPPGGR